MKRKEIKELNQKGLEELKKMLLEAKKALLKLPLDIRGGKVKNYRLLSRTKDDVARMETVIHFKTLKEEK